MRKAVICSTAFIMICIAVLFAEETKNPPPPVFPDSVKVKILKIQLQQAQITQEFQQLQNRMKEIQQQFPATITQLNEAQEEAYKLAKVDKKDWSIDMREITFVAIPKQPEAKKEGK